MFAVAALALFVAMVLVLIRLYLGPTLYDRVLAVNSFGTIQFCLSVCWVF